MTYWSHDLQALPSSHDLTKASKPNQVAVYHGSYAKQVGKLRDGQTVDFFCEWIRTDRLHPIVGLDHIQATFCLLYRLSPAEWCTTAAD